MPIEPARSCDSTPVAEMWIPGEPFLQLFNMGLELWRALARRGLQHPWQPEEEDDRCSDEPREGQNESPQDDRAKERVDPAELF